MARAPRTPGKSGAPGTPGASGKPCARPHARRDAPPSDPSACARCASEGQTCCSTTPGEEEFCFPLSRSEWERIVEWCDHVGGFATERNTRPFVDGMKRLFPGEEAAVEALFPLHGEHLRLAVDRRGDCAFLGAEGCRLPREVRPWYCRLFPLWMRGERITLFTPDHCVAVREGRTLASVLAAVHLTEKDVRLLFGRMRLAWGLPPLDTFGTGLPFASPNGDRDAAPAADDVDAPAAPPPHGARDAALLPKPQPVPDPRTAPRGRRRPPRPGKPGALDDGPETL
ncbi:YkgJ family cysteine cluster protein [Nitratidesulfovibrio sp. 1201_IL3209]|uniref:YkgJ family cysteine cluster protein n=1 Tax=Nitratidesulfovibrio sp. 1201_IL3209 TaxID=3084053 RepID=UPI002FDA041B